MPDETTIYLIRHAHTLQDQSMPNDQWELSEDGKTEAVNLITLLKSYNIEAVFSSPFKKAFQTIAPFCQDQHLHYTIIDGLKERKVSLGYVKDMNETIERSWTDFTWRLIGGESNFKAQMRIKNVLERIAKEQLGKTVAICSHGQVIALFLNSIDKNFGFEDWNTMKMPQIFKISWIKNHFEILSSP